MVILTRLFIRPVKSVYGIDFTHALTDISSLVFDRIFITAGSDDTFTAARQFLRMVRSIPSPAYDGLHLTASDGSSAYIRFIDFTTQDAPAEVWGMHLTVRITPGTISKWLSGFFSYEV